VVGLRWRSLPGRQAKIRGEHLFMLSAPAHGTSADSISAWQDGQNDMLLLYADNQRATKKELTKACLWCTLPDRKRGK